MTAWTGVFAGYAMPAVMLTEVFGFAVTRHSFIGSLLVGAVYVALFLGFGLAVGIGPQLVVQAFIVAAGAAAACSGAYLLERSQRHTFAQAQVVRSLHGRVDALLHQYLSPDVASSLIEDPARAALGGRELEVTVLFADLRGYTSFSEGRSPSEVVEVLNAAFGVAVPEILGEGGTVVQFMGDAVMAIFNAPNPQADHALRASRAALAMQRAVDRLPAADGRPRFRVGLNTGPALVGNIGAAAMRTYSAIGDTINLAARLQTWAPEGSVVMSSGTYALVRDVVVARSLGSPELKGKSVPVEVFELLSVHSHTREASTA
jgi:class 3 adenylate cyclase